MIVISRLIVRVDVGRNSPPVSSIVLAPELASALASAACSDAVSPAW